MATAVLQVRVNGDLKKRVDERLKRMGLNMSTAVNMLLHQIDIQGKIPFEIIDQRDDLLHAIRDIENGKGLSKVYDTPEELYKELGI
ncbi:MAG: type II toxin-antitoxin system RelB/DinJ family antitoxin [Schwartzia succinivorans]|uniref:type II toxin-antitoxin system RelB/DinJ family antitoxin n=1 Tax=Schwartzia succinivorans TaxID=55507 RepID=UPI0023573BC4|nr:type II toxin-antitoxin system RelB/DinJ family antitoxin [Schwartzia succinivorans]MBE6097001.1 type II toxin-antitoxin system RelB/DinJ family antitoxin [Schwartzia succinivorans]MDY6296620.1 type II toxin-antitoxin system RelB/DinJ family antitoxin [Schwartzia succinivorans]